MDERDSGTCLLGHPCAIGGSARLPCPRWQMAFAPTFHPELLDAPLRTKRDRVIGVGLGGDIYAPGVNPMWREQVFEVEHQCALRGKGHLFIHLTKRPAAIDLTGIAWPDLPSQWMGVSVTDDRVYKLIQTLADHCGPQAHRWVSFEPVLSEIVLPTEWDILADWFRRFRIEFVVIGGLTDGNRRIIPPDEPGGLQWQWAQTILLAAYAANCRIFCKGLHRNVWRHLRNPRTAAWMQGPRDLRELPPEWETLRRKP